MGIIDTYILQSHIENSALEIKPHKGKAELSTGRMDPRVGRVGSGRVTILPDFGGSGRVSTLDFFSFLLIISWYLNRYESSNTTFGSIDFLRYLK